ncbi:hypothetical protein [Natribacillus halophilus]|uniref:Uncharacterized protein n=1 Tax=Natribacillus halophilus TaxID=549003 RepID=A0A1G8Q8C9_9BACI|nr:hypothetical protein [Natribacillus halophilus]SDJ01034.1 hypothetical protein SAMN04488123_1119 [Natribacillus halophilus]
MLPPDTFGMYLANVVVLITLLLVMIWKRDAIVKLVTAGRVQSLDKNFMNNVNQRMVNPAMDKATKGMSMVSPTAGSALNKLNQARNEVTRQSSGGQSQGNKVSPETVNHNRESERTPQNGEGKDNEPKNSPSHESHSSSQEKDRKGERKSQKKEKKRKKDKEEPSKPLSERSSELSDNVNKQNKNHKFKRTREKQNKNRKSEAPPPSGVNKKGKENVEKRRKKEKRESKPMKENEWREKPKRKPQTKEF